jgi:hypothetical protein
MAFKLKSPFDLSIMNTPVYHIKDEPGINGRTNMNATIVINSDIKNPFIEQKVIDHEMVHIDQIKRGDLAYDDEYIYWKGERHKRGVNDGSPLLEWEKEAYKKGTR